MSVCHWVGGATAIADKWTITVSLTWAAADTLRVTIGNKTLELVIGSTVTTTQIATELAIALNATVGNLSATSTPALGTGYTSVYGGRQFPEFNELGATFAVASGSTVILTHGTAGIPFTPSVAVTTAGDGDAAIAHTTSATGPNFLSNADNYLAGALPVDNDTLYFDIDQEAGGVDALYDLDYFRTGNIDLSTYVSNDFTGQIGLPLQNANGYTEYRNRYFQFRGGSKTLEFIPGTIGNLDCGACWIDLQDQAAVTIISSAIRNGSASLPSVFLAGADAATKTNTLRVHKGRISIEPDDAGTGATKYFSGSTLTIGVSGGAATDAIVTIGRNARMQYFGSGIFQYSGSVRNYAAVKVASDESGVAIFGGSWRQYGTISDLMGDVEVQTGAVFYLVGPMDTVDKVTLQGGTLDMREGNEPIVLTAMVAYAGSSIYDPLGLAATTINFVGCRISDCTTNLAIDRFYDLSASAAP